MTALETKLINRIRAGGPIPLSEYMSICLLDPDDGYYTNAAPFGQDGDFTTAPEISQMFGEMIGLCLAQAWVDQGSPTPFTLCEVGPGRGTLMSDILRTVRAVPGLLDGAHVCLVEASEKLRKEQDETLADYEIQWHDSVDGLPDAPLFLVANEFFDALPIDQFQRTKNGWSRRELGVVDEKLTFGLGPEIAFPPLAQRLADTGPGDVVEYCPSAGRIAGAIAGRIDNKGGAAIFVDYGGWHSKGDTFQAVKDHAYTDALETPGLADLTAHVDFEAISNAVGAVGNAQATKMIGQGEFLERLGITARAQTLAGQLNGDQLESHIAAHRRLTHPDEMGSLFKVIGVKRRQSPPLAGFEQ